MWAKGEARDKLDGFVRECLKPGTTDAIANYGQTTLQSLGRRCCFSIVRNRKDLQAHLGKVLIDDHPPPIALQLLPEMARCLVEARAQGVNDTRVFINGVASAQRGAPTPEIVRNARVALVFGDLASALRACFDRAYRAVLDGGYQAPLALVAAACLLDADATTHIANCSAAWRDTPEAAHMLRNEAHGRNSPQRQPNSTPPGRRIFSSIYYSHRQVQIARGKSGAWLRFRRRSRAAGGGKLSLLES